jgi:hypothetical protein
MTNDELLLITNAISDIIENIEEWEKDYKYNRLTNEFYHSKDEDFNKIVKNWF